MANAPSIRTNESQPWLKPAVTIQIAVISGILLYHYWAVIRRLVMIWYRDGDWSHGFIIPLFSIYYLYMRRDMLPWEAKDATWMSRTVGVLVLLAAWLLYMASTVVQTGYPKNIALVMSIAGAVILVAGWPIARWSWFAVAFLMFAIPLPTSLYQQMTMPLREIAAEVSCQALQMIPEMMAERQGTVVDYSYKGEPGTLDVERACSGMRLLMTMTALGIAMTFVNERPLWQRVVMILACVPIAVFCNIIRVTTTGLFVVFGRQDLARGTPHMLLGLGMLAVAFSLYGGLSYVLNHLFVEDTADDQSQFATAGEPR